MVNVYWFGTIISAALIAVGFSLLFTFTTGDRKSEMKKNLAIGLCGLVPGFLLGAFVPMPTETHRIPAVLCLATLSDMITLYVYWAVFKERTNLLKSFDANIPLNPKRTRS